MLQNTTLEGLVAFIASLESRLAILLEAKAGFNTVARYILWLRFVDRKGHPLSHFPNAYFTVCFSKR